MYSHTVSLLFTICNFLFISSYALVQEFEIVSKATENVDMVQAVFHFLAQGKVEIELRAVSTSREFILSVYDFAEYDELRRSNVTNLCSIPSIVRLELGAYPSAGSSGFRSEYVIGVKGEYILVVKNCTSPESTAPDVSTESIYGRISLTNPVSTFPLASQYSLEKQGFLAVYSAITGTVIFFAIIWARLLFGCKDTSAISLQLVMSAVFLVKVVETLLRFSCIFLYAIYGVEQASLMKVARMAYEISEMSILALLVVISSTLKIRYSSFSTLRLLFLTLLLCIVLGIMLSECQDFLGTSDNDAYILSITPMKIPVYANSLPIDIQKTSFLAEAIYEPICQVYTMIEFVVSSMTKLVIIVVLHLSIVRLKSEVDGLVWNERKALLFLELVRLLEFRLYYFYYLILPIAVRVLRRLALEAHAHDWVEEAMYQCGIIFFLVNIGIIFKPYDELDIIQGRGLALAIKGDAGLGDNLVRWPRRHSSRRDGDFIDDNVSDTRDAFGSSNRFMNREIELS